MTCGRQYLQQLIDLLPEGVAWIRDDDTNLAKVLAALAIELERVDGRACDVVDEADPRTTFELLADWERTVGIPDECTGIIEDSLQKRRAQVVFKLNATGGASPQYFIDLAAAFGFTITITEPFPFRAGQNTAGQNVWGEEWIHHWIVNANEYEVFYFRAGQSTAGERLRYLANDLLQCIITSRKPAHTIVLFNFQDNLVGAPGWEANADNWDTSLELWEEA